MFTITDTSTPDLIISAVIAMLIVLSIIFVSKMIKSCGL